MFKLIFIDLIFIIGIPVGFVLMNTYPQIINPFDWNIDPQVINNLNWSIGW